MSPVLEQSGVWGCVSMCVPCDVTLRNMQLHQHKLPWATSESKLQELPCPLWSTTSVYQAWVHPPAVTLPARFSHLGFKLPDGPDSPASGSSWAFSLLVLLWVFAAALSTPSPFNNMQICTDVPPCLCLKTRVLPPRHTFYGHTHTCTHHMLSFLPVLSATAHGAVCTEVGKFPWPARCKFKGPRTLAAFQTALCHPFAEWQLPWRCESLCLVKDVPSCARTLGLSLACSSLLSCWFRVSQCMWGCSKQRKGILQWIQKLV